MAFQKLKSLLVKAIEKSLMYFNQNLPFTVQANASSESLAVALLQEGQPIVFASERLGDTEKHYANIE